MAQDNGCCPKNGNTGKTKQCLFGPYGGVILQQIKDADGNRNRILPSEVIADYETWQENLLNDSVDKRGYVLEGWENETHERDAPSYQTFDSGRRRISAKGNKAFTALLDARTPQFMKKLKQFGCEGWGVYFLDEVLRGIEGKETSEDDPYIYPRKIENFYTLKVEAKQGSNQEGITIGFDWERYEEEEDSAYIAKSSVSGSFQDNTGLLDVQINTVKSSAAGGGTAIELHLALCYGEKNNELPHTGLAEAELTSIQMNGVTLTLNTFNEDLTIPGKYDITTVETLTSNEKLTFTFSKIGFDYTTAEGQEITIS